MAAQFDEKSMQRIASVVGYVEKIIRSQPPRASSPQKFSDDSFHARITDTDGSGKYSWTMSQIDSSGRWQDDPDNVRSGNYSDDTGYAVESLYGSANVIIGSIVVMYPALLYDFLLFDYYGGVRPFITDAIVPAQGSIQQTAVASQKVQLSNPYSVAVPLGTTVTAGYGEGVWFIQGADCPAS